MSDLKETGKPKKPAGQAAATKKPRARPRPPAVIAVDTMIKGFKKQVDEKMPDISVGDFIRLVQLRGGLGEETPTEVKVTWVEPAQQESAKET